MTSTDSYPIREAFRKFFPEYLKRHGPHGPIPKEAVSAANAIMKCKTGELGYNVSICEDCGTPVIHAVSCNNRSCPCCQAPLERKWELMRNTELIEGIAYFHVVFTMPHELNELVRANKKELLGLLFKSVHETLLTLCADRRFLGAKPGILSVLHTWGQKLNFHPHIHVCISGGGITPAGQFVESKHKGFFLPKAAAGKMFRGKYLAALKKLYDQGKLDLSMTEGLKDPAAWGKYIDSLYRKAWLPFIRETFNGKGNAIRYLARYSFRTAIANSRIVEITDTHVTFRYKDYADNNKEKLRTVEGAEFIDLFLQHILPARFNRMRSAGYLTNCRKTKNLKLIHKVRNTFYLGNPYKDMNIPKLFLFLYGKDICACPKCSGWLKPHSRGEPLSKLPLHIRKQLKAVS